MVLAVAGAKKKKGKKKKGLIRRALSKLKRGRRGKASKKAGTSGKG